jgi:hypothetical protein
VVIPTKLGDDEKGMWPNQNNVCEKQDGGVEAVETTTDQVEDG